MHTEVNAIVVAFKERSFRGAGADKEAKATSNSSG